MYLLTWHLWRGSCHLFTCNARLNPSHILARGSRRQGTIFYIWKGTMKCTRSNGQLHLRGKLSKIINHYFNLQIGLIALGQEKRDNPATISRTKNTVHNRAKALMEYIILQSAVIKWTASINTDQKNQFILTYFSRSTMLWSWTEAQETWDQTCERRQQRLCKKLRCGWERNCFLHPPQKNASSLNEPK